MTQLKMMAATPALLALLDESEKGRLWRLAVHESGHACMAVLDRIGVHAIGITLRFDGTRLSVAGGVTCPARAPAPPSFYAAGEAAEWMMRLPPTPIDYSGSDDRARIEEGQIALRRRVDVLGAIAAARDRLAHQAYGAIPDLARELAAKGKVLGAEAERIIAPHLHPWRRELIGLPAV